MKLKMLVSMVGGVSLAPGDIHECDSAEAKRLIEAGYAVPFAEQKMERAVKKPAPETRAR